MHTAPRAFTGLAITPALFPSLRRGQTISYIRARGTYVCSFSTDFSAPFPQRPSSSHSHHRRHNHRRAHSTTHSLEKTPIPHGVLSPDQGRRRRRLQEVLNQLAAFRQWCTAQQLLQIERQQQERQHLLRRAPTQQAQTPYHSTAAMTAAATLADVTEARLDPSSFSASSSAWSNSNTNTYSPSAASFLRNFIPPMEHRLLAHYARLLHAVRQAAIEVSTSDFQTYYASSVAAALAPTSLQAETQKTATTRRTRSSSFSVPRSALWEEDGVDAKGSVSKSSEGDAVAQAEQRLAYWAAQWYNEVIQRHSPPSENVRRAPRHSGASEGEEDTVNTPDNGESDSDVKGNESDTGSDDIESLAPLLLKGEWQVALRRLTALSGAAAASHSIETLFTPASLHHRRRVWLRPSLPSEGLPPSSRGFPRLPRRLATAAVTPLELRLLQCPPSEGLRVLDDTNLELYVSSTFLQRTDAANRETNRGSGVKKADGSSVVVNADLLRTIADQEAAHGRDGSLPPSCVVRLRRRLWLLLHLPRSLPPSLVQFEEAKRGNSLVDGDIDFGKSNGKAARPHHSAAMPHAYLQRSETLEKLPWYPLCTLGCVFDILTGDHGEEGRTPQMREKRVAEALCKARQRLNIALFFYNSVDYASVLDYVHLLFVSLGSTMTAHQVAAVTAVPRTRGDLSVQLTAMEIEKAFAITAIALFKPPSDTEYTAAAAKRSDECDSYGSETTMKNTEASAMPHTPEGILWSSLVGRVKEAITRTASTTIFNQEIEEESLDDEVQASPLFNPAPSKNNSIDITAVRHVSAQTFRHLCTVAQSWSNYHRALYCETLSQICDGHGVALQELCDVLCGQERKSNTEMKWKKKEQGDVVGSKNEETESRTVVVLAPESAAAVTTAVLLQRIAEPDTDRVLPASRFVSSLSLNSCPDVLFFAVPHDKAHPVASYFKGLFHPSFFQRVCPEESGVEEKEETETPKKTKGTSKKVALSSTLTLPPPEWERSALARLVGRSLRRVDRYPTRTTEAFFARHIRGDDLTSRRPTVPLHKKATPQHPLCKEKPEKAMTSGVASYAPPLVVDIYTVDLQAAAAHWRGVKHADTATPSTVNQSVEEDTDFTFTEGKTATAKQSDTQSLCIHVARTPKKGEKDVVVLVAAPPQLPHGLHVMYKPAHMNCTLHTHYASLVYPYLSRTLPWQGGVFLPSRAAKAHDRDGPRVTEEEEHKALANNTLFVVPSLRQQGLINRIDVGTSGVVLVARETAALHCAVYAMVCQRHMRKTYRALVQRWPPLPSTISFPPSNETKTKVEGGSNQGFNERGRKWELRNEPPLFVTSPFLSSLPTAVICAPVYAAGATAAAIQQLQQHSASSGAVPDALTTVALPPFITQEDQKYSRPHAALHDRRSAITRYRVLEWFESTGVAYVQVELDSGRRHQIRQHFAQVGFPLLGDSRYHPGVVAGASGVSFGLRRAALHAHSIDLLVVEKSEKDAEGGVNAQQVREEEGELGRIVVQVPLPADMLSALRTLRALEEERKKTL